MGCDIHVYAEYRYPNWQGQESYCWMLGDKIQVERDYYLFALIANVRTYADNVAIYPERGIPQDISLGTLVEFTSPATQQEFDEAEIKNRWQLGDYLRVRSWDWHSATWLTSAEMREVLRVHQERIEESHRKEREAGVPRYLLGDGADSQNPEMIAKLTAWWEESLVYKPHTELAKWTAENQSHRGSDDDYRVVMWFDN